MEHYTLFLLSEPKYGGCSRLAEILGNVSHDSVNRFLLRERYEPKDLFDIVKANINLIGGILSVDDTVLEKIYSNPKYAELIDYFWSGKYHKTVKGLNLITLYYSDVHGNSVPIKSQPSELSMDTLPQICDPARDHKFSVLIVSVLSVPLANRGISKFSAIATTTINKTYKFTQRCLYGATAIYGYKHTGNPIHTVLRVV